MHITPNNYTITIMTRINIGIDPSELCDQHLLAEYRELPRAFKEPKGRAPDEFCLGAGHVNYCAKYQGTLTLRQCDLIDEMRHRGFATNYVAPVVAGRVMPGVEVACARMLLRARIRERLSGMKRNPTWTRRDRPEWAK